MTGLTEQFYDSGSSNGVVVLLGQSMGENYTTGIVAFSSYGHDNPKSIYIGPDIGFQLSFMATAEISFYQSADCKSIIHDPVV
ncbi:MAG: hypothetical protein R3B38_02165 [Patescibacteria group bacterium]